MYFQKNKRFMLGLLFLNSTVLFAQSKDSVRLKAMTYVADKFPLARPLNIEYSNGSSHSFASELEDGTKLPDSKVKKTAELKASVNLPILRKKMALKHDPFVQIHHIGD